MSELGLKRCGELVVVVIGRVGSSAAALPRCPYEYVVADRCALLYRIRSPWVPCECREVDRDTPAPGCEVMFPDVAVMRPPIASDLRLVKFAVWGAEAKKVCSVVRRTRSFLARHARYRSLDGQFLYSSMLERTLDGRTP
jgi:hypothetical protein